MLILVDGYNVTRSDPATAALPLEEQREQLVARLRTRGAELLGPGRIVVVFDGVSGVSMASGPGPVDVRFSRDEPADDVIVRLAAREQAGVRLISSDTALAARVRRKVSGAVDIRGGEAAYADAPVARKRRARRAGDMDESLGVPPGGRRITRELEQLWLDAEDGE